MNYRSKYEYFSSTKLTSEYTKVAQYAAQKGTCEIETSAILGIKYGVPEITKLRNYLKKNKT